MPSRTHLLSLPLILGLLAATPSRADEMGRRVPLDPRSIASQEDEQLVKEAKVATDAAGLIDFFRKRTLSAQDRRTAEGLIAQLGHRSFARREEASRRLEQWGPSVLPFLEKARTATDLEIARRAQRAINEILTGPGSTLPCAAARLLARSKPPEAIPALLEYLPYADDAEVQEAVLSSLVILASDKSRLTPFRDAVGASLPIKRAAAGFVLGRADDNTLRKLVKKLLTDRDPMVRFRAVQGLLAGREKEAVPPLIDLLVGQSPEMTWQAEELLLRIAGEDGPSSVGSSDEKERRLHRERWAKWWSANAGRVDLARIEHDPPLRGWTVVAQMSTNKVYEIDREGKVRWTVDGLQGPIEAWVLPGDRVLIAEHHGSRVSERTFKGEVRWQKRLNDRPVSVQRLPNGNTFVATYSSLMEFTRDGKEVYAHRPGGTAGRIYAGQKMRNGRLLCVTLEGTIVEMESSTGKVLKTLSSGLNGCYSIQGLPGGHYLVASYNQGQVVEVDGAGKVVWRHTFATAYHAERLANGHTLIASHGQSRVIEVNRAGKVLADHATNSNNVWRVHRR